MSIDLARAKLRALRDTGTTLKDIQAASGLNPRTVKNLLEGNCPTSQQVIDRVLDLDADSLPVREPSRRQKIRQEYPHMRAWYGDHYAACMRIADGTGIALDYILDTITRDQKGSAA